MFEIKVNDRDIDAYPGETILTALRRAGVNVPTLCHMPNLTPSGACRICVVEVEGMNGLVPSCSYPVQEGMVIRTHSPRAVRARKTIIELLLASHPDDCLYCVRSGNCDLQQLAVEHGVRERRYPDRRELVTVDQTSPSVVRDPAKCILCGKCVRVCEEVQNVGAIDFTGRGSGAMVAPAFRAGLNISSCVNCGQCILVCPTGALREQSSLREVTSALADTERVCVVQHAPSVSVTLAEEFGMKPGSDVNGLLVAAFRRLGFKYVFDTSFSADLTIMEEASELVRRIQGNGPLPMLTSCSPGWIKYVEQSYPDMIPHLSTCKSPQQMLGAVIKSCFAEREKIDPRRLFSVSVMPCTAKKFEAGRPEMGQDGEPDVDAVLTTRELARMIRLFGIDFTALNPDKADSPFGARSTAGKLFGGSGGVMEAAVRTAHYLITGQELASPKVADLRGSGGIREAKLKIGDLEVGVAVVNGIGNAAALLDQVRAGRRDLHFIEVMTCPGGCVAGGGQPYDTDPARIKARQQSLYSIDDAGEMRTSHTNPEIKRLYAEFLGEPGGPRSHELLHTHYRTREVQV